MESKVVRNLIYAQLSFFLCLVIDFFITTKVFTGNRGLSFYGEHINTAIPFALGFFLCDFFLLRVAKLLPEINPDYQAFVNPIKILAVLLIFIITPDTLNGLFNVIHIMDSSALFAFELAFSYWLVTRWHSTFVTWCLLIAQFVAGVATGLSEFQFTQFLSQGSLIYQIIFSCLFVWVIYNVVMNSARSSMKKSAHLLSDN